MSPWLLLSPLAVLALVAAFIKLRRTTSFSTAAAALSMLALAVCYAVNAEAVYPLADAVLGGRNRAYLVVQLSFVLSSYFLKVAFVPGRRLAGRSGWLLSDTWAMLAVVAAVWVLFLLSDMPETAFRIAPYRAQPAAMAFTQLAVIYTLGCGLLVFRQAVELVRSRGLSAVGQLGAVVMAAAYVPSVLLGVVRLVVAEANAGDPSSPWHFVDGVLVIVSGGLTILGVTLLFLRRRRTVEAAISS